MQDKINAALAHFEKVMREQLERVERINAQKDFIDYQSLDKIIIGVCGGDGIGPVITNEAARVLKYLLDKDVKAGKIEFRNIDGLTIENRAAVNKSIPDDVLAELKKCHVISVSYTHLDVYKRQVLVDGTPFALIIPHLFVENFQTIDDYTSRPYYATLIRILKYI